MAVPVCEVDLTKEMVEDEEATSTQTEKKKKTSKVWLGFVVNNDGKGATCQKCKKVLKINKSTTSNLLNHLTAKSHVNWFNSLTGTMESQVGGSAQLSQATLEETYAKAFDQKKFEELLIKYVVSQDESFILIESSQFKDLIAYLNPKAVMFSRVTLKSKVCFDKTQFKLGLTHHNVCSVSILL